MADAGIGRGTPAAVDIVAAVVLPPLGVFLARGFGPAFWVAVALTFFGWIPGIVFALVAILRPDFMPRR